MSIAVTMTSHLDAMIPEFSVPMGGTTSIDITRPGIDKAYGIGKLREVLSIGLSEMVFAGHALLPGGNVEPLGRERRLGLGRVALVDHHRIG